MAIRTTDEAVEAIIEVDEAISLTPFIEAASQIVTKVCTNTGYDATDLELIERWLSAHFYAIRDPRYLVERAGSVLAEYQNKVDLGFDVTTYGQQAMRLAFYGELGRLNDQIKTGKKQVISVSWVGKLRSEDIDMEDQVTSS